MLEVIESEARIVRLIFTWYINGWSLDKIRDKLSEMAVLTPADTGLLKNGRPKKRGRGQWEKYSEIYYPQLNLYR
jgi:hypothetical protein